MAPTGLARQAPTERPHGSGERQCVLNGHSGVVLKRIARVMLAEQLEFQTRQWESAIADRRWVFSVELFGLVINNAEIADTLAKWTIGDRTTTTDRNSFEIVAGMSTS
jgi:hypothetical protein